MIIKINIERDEMTEDRFKFFASIEWSPEKYMTTVGFGRPSEQEALTRATAWVERQVK